VSMLFYVMDHYEMVASSTLFDVCNLVFHSCFGVVLPSSH